MAESTGTSRRRRAKRLFIVLIIFSIAGTGSAYWYLNIGQWVESTDNAYVRGNMVSIASKVPGVVKHISNDTDDFVEAGQLMAQMSWADADRALEEAKGMLGMAIREVASRSAAITVARSELKLKETTQRLATQEYERRKALLKSKAVAQESVDSAQTRFEETTVELEKARNQLRQAMSAATEHNIKDHPMIKVASARLLDAVRTRNKHEIFTPVGGRVAQRRVQAGQVIDAGQPIFSIVEAGNYWIEANFKETQLRHLRPGQPVAIEADIYGDTKAFAGRVTSIGSGTGAVFSILPPQNATGNWIKIVQRVPVRIDLDEKTSEFPLPIGASLTVHVDTHDRSTPRAFTAQDRGEVSADAVYEDASRGAQALIEQVILEQLAGLHEHELMTP